MNRCYVALGKFGDIFSILPILQHEFEQSGERQILMVSRQYLQAVDRVPFVKPFIWESDWQDLRGAVTLAKKQFPDVVVCQTFGKDFPIQHRLASFQLDQWERSGYLDKWDVFPLTLNREESGKELLRKLGFNGQRFILVADHSQSSPFPHVDELIHSLNAFFLTQEKMTHVVRLSSIRAKHPLDLLSIYDAAQLIITTETMHLHLSKATKTPVIALATDTPSKWHGSAHSRRFVLYLHYGEFHRRKDEFWAAVKTALGGNDTAVPVVAEKPIIRIRREAAIGDALAASAVADRISRMGYDVEFQTHPDIHGALKRQPGIARVVIPNGTCDINLDGAYERDPERRTKHFHQMFMEVAGEQMAARGKEIGNKLNCRPSLVVTESEKAMMRERLKSHPKPWVMICPRSDSHIVRTVPDDIWKRAASLISGTKFWIGRHDAPSNVVDLKCRKIEEVVLNLSVADLLVSTDTGPLHIGASLGIPCVAIEQSSSPELHLSDQRDFVTIAPDLNCLNCQQSVCPINKVKPPCQNIDPAAISAAVNKRLGAQYRDEISAVVAIYRPRAYILNRGLKALLPQVSEIVVCSDQAGVVPDGVMQHPKIRYVKSREHDIGYGRKANYGARHTNGKYILFHNDDVELNRDAVAKMRVEMVDGVGMVSCLLRYRDGTIQHAGKVRQPNERGWGHIDYRKMVPTFKEPVELENVCGACMLVRREAFYKAGAFDEDLQLYTEDDLICLNIRRIGYRIIFTSRSEGIHDEHLSTEKTPGIVKIMHESNAIFGRKAGRYFEHNATRIPGNFDFLKEGEMLR